MKPPHNFPLDSDADVLQLPRTWQTLLLEVSLVLVGGLVGLVARAGIQLGIGPEFDRLVGGWPLDILVINVTGSAVIGVLAGWRDEASRTHEQLWLALAVGFLGSYTTFSSLAGDLAKWVVDGQVLVGVGYLAASFGFGLVAVEGGVLCGQQVAGQHRRPVRPLPQPLEHIAVAYDGTSGSDQAVQLAMNLAGASQAQIFLFSVAERIPHWGTHPTSWDDQADQHLQTLEKSQQRARDRIVAAGLPEPVRMIVPGQPAQQIPALVTATATHVLIVGSHGRSQRAKRMVGSTSYRLFDRVLCSVIVVG